MQWVLPFLVALCSLTAGVATAASGGMPFYPSEQELLTAEGHLVAAVTIEEVRPPIGTRGKPPLVSLRIDAIIRGRIAQQMVEAAWLPPDYHGSTEGDNTPPPSWLAEPLPAPTPGTRLILLLSREGSEFRVANRCRYPDTPQTRRQVRKAIDDYISWQRRSRREQAAAARAERRRIEARRRSWRARATPLLIAHSARDADFIGIGRSSGPNDGEATVEITEILKGVRRKPYRGSAYFAHVHFPPIATDIAEPGRWPDLLLFLTENGMDLDRAPAYALTGVGLVIADAEARKVVRDTLARSLQGPRLPFCVAMIVGYAGLLSANDNRALEAGIADVFVDAGKGRCNVGRAQRCRT